MADIELVIKIPEGLKKDFELEQWTALSCMKIKDALEKAIPLPKGHGDLIDRKELKKDVYTTTEWNGDVHRIIYETSVDDASPIIEADKAESEIQILEYRSKINNAIEDIKQEIQNGTIKITSGTEKLFNILENIEE